jgi:hypothetical protein
MCVYMYTHSYTYAVLTGQNDWTKGDGLYNFAKDNGMYHRAHVILQVAYTLLLLLVCVHYFQFLYIASHTLLLYV